MDGGSTYKYGVLYCNNICLWKPNINKMLISRYSAVGNWLSEFICVPYSSSVVENSKM